MTDTTHPTDERIELEPAMPEPLRLCEEPGDGGSHHYRNIAPPGEPPCWKCRHCGGAA